MKHLSQIKKEIADSIRMAAIENAQKELIDHKLMYGAAPHQ